ncbi:hypothetical protein O181_043162 [Austropuccinia psidii MF-1]|uniref:feruloyl esterase n=1 Tax=Austropuccinia psidii MF-1 TaxID=1389203 RepID=A0A9Q3DP93_9BASI|nr:hypothetical protein [Austropuccinia psidii MF-1]
MLAQSLIAVLGATFFGFGAAADKSVQGCGQKHTTGFINNPATHSIISGGVKRSYAIYIPPNINFNQPTSLIVDYHGNNESPEAQYNNSKYFAYKKGEKYIAVYPAGYKGHWQGPSYADPSINDLQFTTDLLEHIKENYCIDERKIFASGKSNGGGFVDTLACSTQGSAFQAFAMAAAALYTEVGEPKRECQEKRRILESHGLKDKTIPYNGTLQGNGGPLPNINDWVHTWAIRDGLDPQKDCHTTAKKGYDIIKCKAQAVSNFITHYRISELGHCWPSSTGANTDSKRSICKDRALDFTPVVLDFFEEA